MDYTNEYTKVEETELLQEDIEEQKFMVSTLDGCAEEVNNMTAIFTRTFI